MTSNQVERTASEVARLRDNRWLILFFSVVSMVAVANFQYGWTLFVPPLQKHLGVERATIQVTFTVFVLLETWLVPFEGWLVDRFGPRLLVMLGGIFAGLGWVWRRQGGNGHGPVSLVRARRHRRRRGLRNGHRQRAQVVSRSPRPGCRPDRCRIRRRLCIHGHADREPDQQRPDIRPRSSSGASSRAPSSSSPRSSSIRRRRAGCQATGRRWTPGTT